MFDCQQVYKQQQNGAASLFLSSTPAWNASVMLVAGDSLSSKWATAASLSKDTRRTDARFPLQKDRLLTSQLPAQRTQSLDHDGRRAWVVQPTKKFDDTDEEAQSPMVTSHNGLPGISPLMTSSLCSTTGDDALSLSRHTHI